jgi:hypothetical protein
MAATLLAASRLAATKASRARLFLLEPCISLTPLFFISLIMAGESVKFLNLNQVAIRSKKALGNRRMPAPPIKMAYQGSFGNRDMDAFRD